MTARLFETALGIMAPWSVAVFLLVFSPVASFAQLTPERLLGASSLAADLDFPAESSRISSSSFARMALYKPEGPGPFPALVLHHQCSGLGNVSWQNLSMLNWARQAVARGYVAFLIDSLGPRGVTTVCMGPQRGVNFMRGVKDALQAAAHLRKFEFVDSKRIALAGYSWGAMVGLLASSRLWGATLGAGERFAAVVSFYPGCFTIRPPGGEPYEIANADIDRPLLVLMGGQDTETPAAECVAKLDTARAAGAPVEWHLYPGNTHCWDCENLDGKSKIDVRGNHVVYRYDEAAVRDSAQRMFRFLEKNLAAH